MNPIQSLQIDGVPAAQTTFAVPSMSLSSSRLEMCEHAFVVAANASDLVDALAPAYFAWVAESRRDDELSGSPQDELGAAGYPPLDEVLLNPSLAELVLGHYLLNEFLGKFTWDGTSTIEYWFDRTTSCHLADGVVFLTGLCYG